MVHFIYRCGVIFFPQIAGSYIFACIQFILIWNGGKQIYRTHKLRADLMCLKNLCLLQIYTTSINYHLWTVCRLLQWPQTHTAVILILVAPQSSKAVPVKHLKHYHMDKLLLVAHLVTLLVGWIKQRFSSGISAGDLPYKRDPYTSDSLFTKWWWGFLQRKGDSDFLNALFISHQNVTCRSISRQWGRK